jgi:hypothetical protein
MILGTIDNDDSVPPPLWSLLIKPGCQVSEEELHHLGVGVGLGKCHIHIAKGVQAKDYSDSWLHLELWEGIGGSWHLPLHLPEVGHSEPGLIDVDEDLLFSSLG